VHQVVTKGFDKLARTIPLLTLVLQNGEQRDTRTRPCVHALLTLTEITFETAGGSKPSVAEKAHECPKNLLKIRFENLKTASQRQIATML
jgi:hypothetical protein